VVGIVIVSHSARLAEGVVELARQMGGEELALEAAGGMDDGSIGTDMALVLGAIERARSPEGVLVLMDLGSALMSAEMAVEMAGEEGGRVLLSEAPLIEGAVAAATSARVGMSLEEVAAEARGALRAKQEQLGVEGAADPSGEAPAVEPGDDALELRLRVDPAAGLHARPAARFAVALSGHDAAVTVANATRGGEAVDGRSLSSLQRLGVREGEEILVRASGPDAAAVLDALRALAAENFGDPVAGGAPAAAGSGDGRAPDADRGADDGGAARSGAGVEAPGSEAAAAESTPVPAPGTRLRGVAASSGIAIGPAQRLGRRRYEVAAEPGGTPQEEWTQLEAARAAARADLEETQVAVAARAGAGEADIFVAHLAILDDPALLDPARAHVDDDRVSAALAWQRAAAAVAAEYRGADSEFLRERAVDVEDVAGRVLAHLEGEATPAGLAGEGILVADELTPGDAAGLDPAQVHGIATARGGATAHAAILARALGIPAVVGLGPAILAVEAGTRLALDGNEGIVEVDPDEAVLAEREARRAEEAAAAAAALERAGEPGALRDGHRVEVFANIGAVADVAPAVAKGAEGVGLLRTEFLFLDRAEPPDEEEQTAVLREIAVALDGRPLVVRTLDAGADKPLPFLRQAPEDNPFLGVRGVRLSLAQPELFRTQLRAVLRVAEDHRVALMFPMVTTVDELLAARRVLDEARAELGVDPPLEVGVMVEVPALALAADRVAPHVDFFSIGTNDLAQYTMAAERGSGALAGLLEGPLPPVLALIDRVCAAAREHGRWVGVCGELAGDPDAAVLLAGLGVRELSMAAGRIPAVKAALQRFDLGEATAAARRAVGAADAAAARATVAAPGG
jgi:phosphoenolpyruvate-protein phosphotransferase/dihydroxyacetone kinase phosphotransfer subunit